MCECLSFSWFSHLRLFDRGVSSSLLLSHPFKTFFFSNSVPVFLQKTLKAA